jgi:DNA-binding GntR family transcriptional regulator
MDRSLDEHVMIATAVTQGEAEAASAAARNHITSGFGRYMQMLDQEPGYPA